MNPRVVVSGAFDDLRSAGIRFLEQASKCGELTVLLWSDETAKRITGCSPKFPEQERLYFLNAVRYVDAVRLVSGITSSDVLPQVRDFRPDIWAMTERESSDARSSYCGTNGIRQEVIASRQLEGFPVTAPTPSTPARKKVLVTGCYDWFHSGHVRFFEEVSTHGDLYVVVGHDANIRLLKGEGHPLLNQDERRYLVGSIKFVKQALISTGNGWLDAEPEILKLRPDIYAVNEDGDKGGKREYCEQHGIEYLVLQRTPAPGLPKRSSTILRGF